MSQLPLDQAGVAIQCAPASRGNASSSTSVNTAAVDLELTAGTRRIEVYALAFPLFINYVDKATDAASSTSFDKVVAAGERQLIVLPDGTTAINMISTDAATAYVVEYA